MCTRARPSEGLDSEALEDGVLQVVSEPTLVVVRMGQCADIWCIARVGPDGTHGMAYGAGTGRACTKRGQSWTFARVGELYRRGCQVL